MSKRDALCHCSTLTRLGRGRRWCHRFVTPITSSIVVNTETTAFRRDGSRNVLSEGGAVSNIVTAADKYRRDEVRRSESCDDDVSTVVVAAVEEEEWR